MKKLKIKMVKMTNDHHPQIFSTVATGAVATGTPKFPFDDKTDSCPIDDEDNCIICGRLYSAHSEDDAYQCYFNVTKKQRFKKQLSKKRGKS